LQQIPTLLEAQDPLLNQLLTCSLLVEEEETSMEEEVPVLLPHVTLETDTTTMEVPVLLPHVTLETDTITMEVPVLLVTLDTKLVLP